MTSLNKTVIGYTSWYGMSFINQHELWFTYTIWFDDINTAALNILAIYINFHVGNTFHPETYRVGR